MPQSPRTTFSRVGQHRNQVGDHGRSLVNRTILGACKSLATELDTPGADSFLVQFDSRPVAPAHSNQRRIIIDRARIGDAGFWVADAPKLKQHDTIFVSSSGAKQMLSRLFDAGPRIIHMPFGVDIERFSPPTQACRANRLLAIGSDNSLKRLDLTIHFYADLRARLPDLDLTLCLIPGGASNSRIESWLAAARASGVAKHITVTRPIPAIDMPKYYQQALASITFSTAMIENFGMTIAESLACGTPVIASNWGGFRDIVKNGENGLLADTAFSDHEIIVDWETVTPAAERIILDSNAWGRMSRNARLTITGEFSIRKLANQALRHLRATFTSPANPNPVTFSPQGEELIFNTILMYRTPPPPKTSGEEFRRLRAFDNGRSAHLLRGDQASKPPRWLT